jgi:hypothetical protein
MARTSLEIHGNQQDWSPEAWHDLKLRVILPEVRPNRKVSEQCSAMGLLLFKNYTAFYKDFEEDFETNINK